MSGIRNLLNIARSALSAQQAGMNVVGHNIANANTEGYSKQEIMFSNRPGTGILRGESGTGVDAGDIRQRQAVFADKRILKENTRLGQWDVTRRILEQAEIAFSGAGESDLNTVMNDFFNAWEDLSSNPESVEFRNQLLHKSEALTAKFHAIDDSLSEVRKNTASEFRSAVNNVNSIIDKIDDLNTTIEHHEIDGGRANDLRDQRQNLINDLSKIINIQTTETNTGVTKISFNGRLLLGRNTKQYLRADSTASDASNTTTVFVGNKEVDVSTGELGGLKTLHDSTIPGYKQKLDDIAGTIVKQVNNLHGRGYGLDGSTGKEFFISGGTTAASITVSVDLRDSPNSIATAGTSFDPVAGEFVSNGPGDNSIARRIANIRNVPLLNGRTATLSDSYTDLYAQVGFDTANAKNNKDSHQGLMDQMQNYRESIVGVSIDEELADMLKFQNSYGAAARLITVADDMMKTLINVLG